MGSNPTLSAGSCVGPLRALVVASASVHATTLRICARLHGAHAILGSAVLRPSMAEGEMTEWPKVHAWKACVLARVPWVRIPLSPNSPLGVDIQVIRYELLPNPARPGREQR